MAGPVPRWLDLLARHRARSYPAAEAKSDYQVEFGGEIRLACGRGPRDRRAHQAGYLREATPDTRGPGAAAAAGPCSARPPCRRPGSPRNRPAAGSSAPARPAGARIAATARHRLPPPDRRREVRPPPHPRPCGKHRRHRPARTAAGQTLTRARPLRRLRREDGAASPGAHAQPEAMRLRPTAVVRLERTLAHWDSRSDSELA